MSIHNKHSGLDLDKKGRVLPAECSLQKKKKITCIIYNIYIYKQHETSKSRKQNVIWWKRGVLTFVSGRCEYR